MYAGASNFLFRVRLVRACGSKPVVVRFRPDIPAGQARKSLWIETEGSLKWHSVFRGQARKSLWIETITKVSLRQVKLGQARKSLWIETGLSG